MTGTEATGSAPATPPAETDGTGARRRWPWVLAGVAVVGALAVVGLAVPLFVSPAVDDPRPVDAVVVLAGGGNRYDPAVSLVEQGYADVVAFSDPGRSNLRFTANQYCNSVNGLRVPDGVEQICFDPDPSTTQGEVREIARMADARGWESVMMVASTDQVTRARVLLERCWDGDIVMIGVPHDQPVPFRVVYEYGATLNAFTLKRGC